MKRYSEFFLSLAAISILCSSCRQQSWQIDGRLDGDVNGSYVYLHYADTSRALIDSACISGNSFTLRGKSESIRSANLTLGKTYKNRNSRIAFPLFLEKGHIQVQANYDKARTSGRISDNYILSGTPSNRIFMEYMNATENFDRNDRKIFEIYGNHLMRGSNDHSRTYFEEGIRLTRQIDSLKDLRIAYTLSYLEKHHDSEAAFSLFIKILPSLNTDHIDRTLRLFPESVKQSAIGQAVVKQAESVRLSAEGATYSDHEFTLPDGESRRLSDYIGRGEYILLECWASWCGPCKRDIPHVKEVMKKYGGKGFRIIGISLDTDREAWKKAIEEYSIPWTQLSDLKGFTGSFTRTYKIRGIPTCILIDPQGKIIMRNARGAWLDRWLITQFGDPSDKNQ